MEIKAALAGVLVACATLTGAACAGPRENASESPGDEPSRSSEAARTPDAEPSISEEAGAETPAAETTGPSTQGSERTKMEASGRERGGATGAGAGRMKEKRGGAGEARKRDPSVEVVVVKIEGLVYEPSQVKVSPGSTVRWVNEDPAEHTVTSEQEDSPLRSDVFEEGGSFEYTFQKPGEFPYFCEVHRFMKGIVVVR